VTNISEDDADKVALRLSKKIEEVDSVFLYSDVADFISLQVCDLFCDLFLICDRKKLMKQHNICGWHVNAIRSGGIK
jgi:hypothetical protein